LTRVLETSTISKKKACQNRLGVSKNFFDVDTETFWKAEKKLSK
jgi:hypothetical protein